MFVGRKTELKFLQDKYNSPKAQLVILYGRRRVGKTETLREFCRGKPHVFYSCTQSTDKVQLARFSQQMLREDLPAKRYISQFSDWEMAFRSISDLPFGDHKKLVVIDEFPYMCKGDHILAHPAILLPPTIASAITGPLATTLFQMKNTSASAGMGTSGLVGQFGTWAAMAGESGVLFKILLLHIVLPAALTLLISEFMRKKGWIKFGDMKLDL